MITDGKGETMVKSLSELPEKASSTGPLTLAVAAAEDKEVLEAVKKAESDGMIRPVLFGNEPMIRQICHNIDMPVEKCRIYHCDNPSDAAFSAVKSVKDGESSFLMKGLVDTPILLKAVLQKDMDLKTDQLLSHIMIYEPSAYTKLLFLTDGGMNIAPILEEKRMIIENAVKVAFALGVNPVKVACVTASEKVSEKIQSTVDAAALKVLSQDGLWGENVIVEGPIAFDLAVSKSACKIKRFESPVGGDADVLMVPTIDVGNGIGKTLTYMAGAPSAGIVMGARVPIVLVSRADSMENKYFSIALGSVIASSQIPC